MKVILLLTTHGLFITTTDMNQDEILRQALEKTGEIDVSDKGYYALIFSHEFAKKFWPDTVGKATVHEDKNFRGHLFESDIDANALLIDGEVVPIYVFNKEDKRVTNLRFSDKGRVKPNSYVALDTTWKDHLMIMAREEEPLKYIQKFL